VAGLLYLDSSALVKLVLPERETTALMLLLRSEPHPVTSEIAMVEVPRAARRASSDERVWLRAEEVLAAVSLVPLRAELLRQAARLTPAELRSLDAIHLASALSLSPDLVGVVAYDERLASAARSAGLKVLSPVA